MLRKPQSLNWMHAKYGDDTSPFEVTILMANNQGGVNGQWSQSADNNQFNYYYQRKNQTTGDIESERMPKRQLRIKNPNDYRGELGIHKCAFWHNTDEVFIVNGLCMKADGNFLGAFHFKTIGDDNVTIGCFPQEQNDIEQIRNAGCTAVMNIMTH